MEYCNTGGEKKQREGFIFLLFLFAYENLSLENCLLNTSDGSHEKCSD